MEFGQVEKAGPALAGTAEAAPAGQHIRRSEWFAPANTRGAPQSQGVQAFGLAGVESNGKESRRLHQAAGQGRAGQSQPARRSCAGPARPEHHGILQGVQCRHAEVGAGPADSDRDHRVFGPRSEEHTSELQPLMRISYAVFCLKQKKRKTATIIDISNNTYK